MLLGLPVCRADEYLWSGGGAAQDVERGAGRGQEGFLSQEDGAVVRGLGCGEESG